MASTRTPNSERPWRSASALPLRPARVQESPFATATGRIPLTKPSPAIPGEPYRPKAFNGEAVPFGVTAFREGHDRIGVHLRLHSPSGDESLHRVSPLENGLDRWATMVALREDGLWTFRFEAFGDDFLTWQHAADVKIEAGVDIDLMREMGALLFDRAQAERDRPAAERKTLAGAAAALRDAHVGTDGALAIVRDPAITRFFAQRPLMSIAAQGAQLEILVERERAGVGAWYEFFPRSEGAKRFKDGRVKPGNLRTARSRIPAVRGMGFDVLYIPPVHPIGTTNRKGRNNSLTAEPGDPGSPYGIGSPDGGHDAVSPELGTMADFRAFVRAAAENGMEVALDLALNASPDHPWVTEHPEWFVRLPDGSIAYAENPPKKYQDIYPVYFDTDPAGAYAEVLRVVRHWIAQGVTIFRVDNPHTKPLEFWEWLIATVNAERPDVIFLAEAFSRPEVMQTLAKAGFQQSYSYYTWRNTKQELEEFFTSIATETADFMRPNLFVNTHDILTEYLQFGGRPAYAIRAALAATAAPTWGVYAGYELFENVARPGSEENIDNEKYEIKVRDWEGAEARGDSLAPWLRRLNEIRRDHPALRQLRNLTVHWSDDDAILVFAKHLPAALSPTGRTDTIIVVANTDPHSVRQTMVHLDTAVWGVEPGDPFDVEDLVTGARWTWSDHNFVMLDAFTDPVHILHVKEKR
ncbi:maltotransferase domain-containing protein [Microbacterium sp. Root180]|uniref:maltotransferase domain-containing protein n=1 Tax=Microbacterium sp. Root180 TaxID=1736483 RepID=UPI0006F80C67|nr:maltotransferase domain-containing protein [Microbacterium sp. Root180]KRB38031.1 alpha-1,4-glucan--maltose-1-phosphate maltosyltransferase [Microbacterium sp. Root180]